MDHLDHVNGDEINENLNPEVNQNVDEGISFSLFLSNLIY